METFRRYKSITIYRRVIKIYVTKEYIETGRKVGILDYFGGYAQNELKRSGNDEYRLIGQNL